MPFFTQNCSSLARFHLLIRLHAERPIDRARNVALRILQLSFRQCRSTRRTPVHWLLSAIDVSAKKHITEHSNLRSFVFLLQREVRRIPVSPHPKPLKLLSLSIHSLSCKVCGDFAQLLRLQTGGFLLATLQNLKLNWKSVAIPTGNQHPAPSTKKLISVDKVLEHFVKRVAHVQRSVRVRWSVVENKLFSIIIPRQLFIDFQRGPQCLQLWLA
mmetsp:Transcript_3390/g.7305  ORF Transcript_3390/g.7305 Transcript_3390/m.7305 type:complete len:214 (-) Transcript_3390:438-1079(-)